MTADVVAAKVRETTASSGVPERLEDALVAARVAAVLKRADRPRPAA